MEPALPAVSERLERAALELFAERGFAQTTVADIAARAGLTKRTFFRHFADKREVLFSGQSVVLEAYEAAIAIAPDGASPMSIAVDGLYAIAFIMEQRRALIHERQAVIDANPDLQERELLKVAALTSMVHGALRRRGFDELTAALTAHVALGSFSVAFDDWVRDDATSLSLRECIARTLEHLTTVASTPVVATS